MRHASRPTASIIAGATISVIALAASLLSGCSSVASGSGSSATPCGVDVRNAPPPASLDPLIAQARAEGTMNFVFVADGGSSEVSCWNEGFNSYYGLHVTVHQIANPNMPQVANQLVAEAQANRPLETDVYFGVSVFVRLLEQTDNASYGSLKGLPYAAPYAEDRYDTVSIGTQDEGITFNTVAVPPSIRPHTLAGILALPKSVHLASSPYAGILAILPLEKGIDFAITYVTKLSRRLSGLLDCGEESQLVSGVFDMFIPDCGGSPARILSSQGAPIGHIVLSDLPVLNEWYVAIPRTSLHPAVAKLWINYLMSPQGQAILWKYDRVDYWRIPGSHESQEVAALRAEGYKLIDTNMVVAHADGRFSGADTCVQDLLNNEPEASDCAPYQALIRAAGGT